ncbi:MAG: CheR family methyltransferase [Phycisphaerae bacterium]
MSKPLSITEFHVFRDYLRRTCGLYFTDDKYDRVAGTVGARMSELGMSAFSEYYDILASSPRSRDELSTLAARLTVGETHFFRNKQHWRAFSDCVLPWIVERNAENRRKCTRIWSAGCSTGEEAYTIAMVLRRSLPDSARWAVEIIATDLSPAAIAAAERALYTQNAFRGVSPGIKREYFEPADGGRWRLRADIRGMVRFREMNLLDEAATAQIGDVDVIFCRNVLIYFDAAGVRRVLSHFHRSLRPDGYLFLGHAESVSSDSSGFASLNVCDTFIYKRIPLVHSQDAADSRDTSFLESHHTPPQAIQKKTAGGRPSKSERAPWKPGRTAQRVEVESLDVPEPSSDKSDAAPKHTAPVRPKPAATPVTPPVEALRIRAIDHLCAEEEAEALQTFEAILKREPGDPESLLGMALLLAGKGSDEAALQCCERVLKSQPLSAEAYCVMALVHEGRGEDAIARREFEKAVYLDDGFSMAHFHLGGLHNRARRRDAAARCFGSALKALPNDDERRVRLYSGGFSKERLAQTCEQFLATGPAAPRAETSAVNQAAR